MRIGRPFRPHKVSSPLGSGHDERRLAQQETLCYRSCSCMGGFDGEEGVLQVETTLGRGRQN